MASAKIEREIEGLLAASQRPFENRLQAAIYVYMAEEGYGSQEHCQVEAVRLAAFIERFGFTKVSLRKRELMQLLNDLTAEEKQKLILAINEASRKDVDRKP